MIKKWINKKKRFCFLGAAVVVMAAGFLMTANAKDDSFVTWNKASKKNEVAVSLRLQDGEELEDVVTFQVKFQLEGEDIRDAELVFDSGLKSNKEIPVKTAIYDDENQILSVYVSGRETVLSHSPLKLGKIRVDSGKDVVIRYLEDSGDTVDRFHTAGKITELGGIEEYQMVLEDKIPETDESVEEPETKPERETESSKDKHYSSHDDDDDDDGGSISMDSDTPGSWKKSGDAWLFEKPDGTLIQNQWIQAGGKWYWLDEKGRMKTGWISNQGIWYYCGPAGDMKTGWVNDLGTWYYCNGSGAMKTGWITYKDCWYYLKDNGAMKTGWQEINGKWYYLEPDGKMAANTVTPDGYRLDRNGVWTGERQ